MSEQTTTASAGPPTSASSSRRSSISRPAHRRGLSGITPRELKYIDDVIPLDRRQKWKKYSVQPIESTEQFESEFVRNVETTLGRSLFNCDALAAYQATARSLRDTLIVRWNRTQQKHTLDDPKRVYYLSLEYLMGRALDNAALNLGLEGDLKQGLDDFGFKFEDLVEREPDAGLGNGGLGRLAACFVDSLCTLDYPAWAYGIRYKYGIFRQKIVNGAQVEFPDTWLDFGNPWEIPRPEVSFDIMFYGRVEEKDGKKQWVGGDLVEAKAYDFLVPGFETKNVNTLRLWQAEPSSQFDFARFNEGDYSDAVSEQVDASTISAVLYPNDNFYEGKELRLKQQYFWVAASLADILRRFKKTRKPWSQFADSCAIQLNDTHPTLAIVELLRLLVDKEGLDWHEAWAITTSTFAYTNHTVMPEALEKWGVDVLGNLLPRHLEIIYNVNYFFLKDVKAKFPGDEGILSRVSLIEESTPKQVRMAYLAVIASHKVNGVAELHSDLIKTTIFADFVKIFGEEHFTNITNGITPRRWLLEANPQLAALIASKLGGYEYIKDLDQLTHLSKYVDDKEFRENWTQVKENNKVRLIELIKSQHPNVEIDPTSLFDIQVKRIHEYKRQQLNLFGIVYRYLYIKSLTPEQRRLIAPRVFIFGGKSAPGYYAAKLIIKLINSVGKTIDADPDVSKYLKIIYIEEYNVSKAQILVAASDISEHISTAGTEASGTSNMKFVLNGGLIIGTVDGANIEIGREIGEDNIYYFGHLSESVDEVRAETSNGVELSDKLSKVFATIDSGVFGDAAEFAPLLDSIRNHGDYYLVNADFDSYINTQSKIDEDFKDKEAWTTKSITSVSKMGFFSSDRAINQYAEDIWDIQPNPVEGPDPLSPKPAHATVSAATGTVADRKAPNKKKRNSTIKKSSGGASAGATAAALGAVGAVGGAAGLAAASGREASPSTDTSSQYSAPGAATGSIPTTGAATTSGLAAGSGSGSGSVPGSHGSTSTPTSTGHQTYVVGGSKVIPSAEKNTAAGAAATAAFNKDSSSSTSAAGAPHQETYNPLGSADEGQVTGSYTDKSAAFESEPASYGSAVGGSGASYGTTGSVPAPSSGTLDSTRAPVSGEFEGSSSTTYNPYGSKSDPAVPVHDTDFDASQKLDAPKTPGYDSEFSTPVGTSGEFESTSRDPLSGDLSRASAPVSGDFEGTSSQKYDPHGSKGDPAVPVHNTEFETAAPPRNSGMFSEISSASSIETADEDVSTNSLHRNLVNPNSVSTASIDTAKLKPSETSATPPADKSFTGPSSQEIPKEADNSWSATATGLAAGAGAAVVGGAAALLGKTGLKGDSANTSTNYTAGTHTSDYNEDRFADAPGTAGDYNKDKFSDAPGTDYTGSSSYGGSSEPRLTDSTERKITDSSSTPDYTGSSSYGTTGAAAYGIGSSEPRLTDSSEPKITDAPGASSYGSSSYGSETQIPDSTRGLSSVSSSPYVDARDTSTPTGSRAPDASYGNSNVSANPTSQGYSTDGYDPLGSKNEGQVSVHDAKFATDDVKPNTDFTPVSGQFEGGSTQKYDAHGLKSDPTVPVHDSTSSKGLSSNSAAVGGDFEGVGSQKYDPHGSNGDPAVPVHDTHFATEDAKSKSKAPFVGAAAAIGATGAAAAGLASHHHHTSTSRGATAGPSSTLGGSSVSGGSVSGDFEGVGSQKYDPHGSKTDPAVPVHDTHFTGAEHAKSTTSPLATGATSGTGLAGSSRAPVSGDFEGVGSQKYDPHGSKTDPAVPVHDTEFSSVSTSSTNPKASLSSKFNSLDHAGLGEQVTKHSKTAQDQIGKTNVNIGGHNSKEIGAGVAGAGALGAAGLAKYGDRLKGQETTTSTSGATSGAPVSGDFEGTGAQQYDPHGSRSEAAVPVHDTHFATEQTKPTTDFTGSSSRAPVSGDFEGTSTQKYDPHGSKGDPAVPVHDAHFATEDAKAKTSAPVSGDFEGVGSQKYDPHGSKTDPAVPVHDTEFGSKNSKAVPIVGGAAVGGAAGAAAGYGASSGHNAPVSGEFEGAGTSKYDPHGSKGDATIPVHDTQFSSGTTAGSASSTAPKAGLSSKFNNLDHAGLGEQVSKHSKTAQDHIGKTNVNIGGHNSKEIGAGVAGAGALGAAGLAKYGDRLKGQESSGATSGAPTSGAPVSGEFEGTSTSKYDPHGSKTDPTVSVHDTKFNDPNYKTLDPEANTKGGDYKTLDPAAKSDKYVTELGNTTSKPVVTDGIQSGQAPTKSIGTETGVHSNTPHHGASAGHSSHGGATAAGVAAATGAAATAGGVHNYQRAPDSQASVLSLDSRTAPVPDSGATVSGIPQERFAAVNEASDRNKNYGDNRRHSRESYSTTGETDFEDAVDYGSPEPHHGHGAAYGAAGVAAAGTGAAAYAHHRDNDNASISSQSTIGKRQAPKTEAVVPATEAVVPAGAGAGAVGASTANTTGASAGPHTTGASGASTGTPAAHGSPLASAGTATTTATKDTRPSTAATGTTIASENKAAHHHTPQAGAPDYIPTNVLQQNKNHIGGDGSALEGPPIDKEKVEEMHDEIIQAARADGHTQGITSSGAAAAAADVKNSVPGKHSEKHAGKEGEEVSAPDSKKCCRCC